MRRNRWSVPGFTLIELMLVVAIIGLLAAIALPRFANLVVKSKEAAIKGQLGTMRSAISLYYVDNEGFLPASSSPGDFYLERYLDTVPRPILPNHQFPMTNMLFVQNSSGCNLISTDPGWGNGSWMLCRPRATIILQCLHTDTKGNWISEW
ncbi:MAG: type II secretion system protein [Elusimicrobia bacterium]|nr:type II secretion system protein [Elusimicrobiota bacterium]